MVPVINCKIITLVICVVLFACAGVPLNEYQPRSADEKEIIKVIIKHESTWNEQDISGFMATFHSSAIIADGCNGPLLTKSEFVGRIKQIMAEYPTVKLINPKLNVSGSEAVVKVTSTEFGDEIHLFRIEMLKENYQWLITKETCN
jgi:hypothetical protein